MLVQSIRASRQALVRVARHQPVLISRRTFIVPTAVRQADLVQDLYLRELKAYKPSPVKASDAEGHVQKFTIPSPPPSPEESDIANDLKTYETQQVELEHSASGGEGGAIPVEEDWFEEEDDTPPTPTH